MPSFSPTPIPEPVNPPPSPQPVPDPTIPMSWAVEPVSTAAAEYAAVALPDRCVDASWERNLLRLLEHAFWVLTAHGIGLGGPFPLVCAACSQAWPCPSISRATDWILVARRHGLLEEFDIHVSDNIVAIIERWHRNGLALAAAEAA